MKKVINKRVLSLTLIIFMVCSMNLIAYAEAGVLNASDTVSSNDAAPILSVGTVTVEEEAEAYKYKLTALDALAGLGYKEAENVKTVLVSLSFEDAGNEPSNIFSYTDISFQPNCKYSIMRLQAGTWINDVGVTDENRTISLTLQEPSLVMFVPLVEKASSAPATTSPASTTTSNTSSSGGAVEDEKDSFAVRVYSKVTLDDSLTARGITVADVAEATQAEALKQIDYVRDNLKDITAAFGVVYDEEQFYRISDIGDFVFEVGNAQKGTITLTLNDQKTFSINSLIDLYDVDNAGYLNNIYGVVSHLKADGTWELMTDFARIDREGRISFTFDSYSPIIVQLVTIGGVGGNTSAVKGKTVMAAPDATVLVKARPQAQESSGTNVQTDAVSTAETVSAPKTGEADMYFICFAFVGLVLTAVALAHKKAD